jgi:hypothetical protein
MSQANFVQDGVDRVSEAVRSLPDEVQRVQKRLQARRKTVEKRTRKEVRRIQREFERNAWVKRARSLANDATRQIESRVDDVLGLLQIASKNDVQRMDRKLNQITRKLKEMEHKGNGAARA